MLKNIKDKKDPTSNKAGALSCKKCGQGFYSNKTLKKHNMEAHPLTLDCKMCDERFWKNHELETHLMDKHNVDNNINVRYVTKNYNWSGEWKNTHE